MELRRADSNDRSCRVGLATLLQHVSLGGKVWAGLAVFSMQVSDLEGVFAPFDDVVVAFE